MEDLDQLAIFGGASVAPAVGTVDQGVSSFVSGGSHKTTLPMTEEARERFWSSVVKGPGDSCWIWCGAISSPDGYGRFTWQSGGVRRTLSAHRVALLLMHGGELEEGLVGEHSCCEPLCVRVAQGHLHVTDQATNIAYAVQRGRHSGNREIVGSSGRHARSLRVRAAVVDGWDERLLALARSAHQPSENQLQLW